MAKVNVGDRFGRLVTVRSSNHPRNGRPGWMLVCDCSADKTDRPLTFVTTGDLSNGHTQSCGCKKKKYCLNAGDRFGRLVVVTPSRSPTASGRPGWMCVCDCSDGSQDRPLKFVDRNNLTGGRIKSCGCIQSKVEGPLTVERLREVLAYDSSTGFFTWLMTLGLGSRAVAGELAGSKGVAEYWYIGIDGKRYRSHRLAWFHFYGEWPSGEVDHFNGDPGDNRISNLRLSTHSKNGANRSIPSNNTSGFKGVSLDKRRKKWDSRITVNGRQVCLGLFPTREEAALAYIEASEKYHGAFAHINRFLPPELRATQADEVS